MTILSPSIDPYLQADDPLKGNPRPLGREKAGDYDLRRATAGFGKVPAFSFYGSRIPSKIPREETDSILPALSSCRKLIALFSPAVVEFPALIKPTLPYLLSLLLFVKSNKARKTLSLVRTLFYSRG